MRRASFARAVAVTSIAIAAVASRAAAQNATPPSAAAPADSVATVDVTQLGGTPDMANRDAVARAIAQSYVRLGDVSGRVMLFFLVDERGVPRTVEVTEPSGNPAMDREAVRVGQRMRFAPPTLDGRRVRVRMQMPVTFGNPQG